MGVLSSKVAMITGASSGTGRAIAQCFVAEGAQVVLLARDKERLEAVAEQLGPTALPVPTDVGNPEEVAAAMGVVAERLGRLDILVNNAAVYRPCRVEKLSNLDIDRQIRTNFYGPIHTCRSAIPLLRASGGGDIVNTSSESTLRPFPMLSLYVSTKAALEMFTHVLADEVAVDDIRVTTVVQGTAQGAGNGSTDWDWDPDDTAEALAVWEERGLLSSVLGQHGGQFVHDVAAVHLFIVTRPRGQKLDRVHCRSF